MGIKHIAIQSVTDFCTERDIKQNMDNLETFYKGEATPVILYNGVNLEQLVKELMAWDSTLTNDAAWQLAYEQAEK